MSIKSEIKVSTIQDIFKAEIVLEAPGGGINFKIYMGGRMKRGVGSFLWGEQKGGQLFFYSIFIGGGRGGEGGSMLAAMKQIINVRLLRLSKF